MSTPDVIALGYFGYVVVAAVTVPGTRTAQRLKVASLAVASGGLVLLAGWLLAADSVIRVWLPAVWLVVGYWLPGGLLREPMPGLEAWLRASDRWLRDWPSMQWARSPAGWLAVTLELAYLLVHVFVPAALAVLLYVGLDAPDRLWTPTLLAGYICYGTLPWMQARPPRLVDPPPAAPPDATVRMTRDSAADADAGTVRRWNEGVLNRVGVQANTFPSGHVAVALIVALVVFDRTPGAGLVFVPLALLIAVATVIRRYHYSADVGLGLVVALVCWAATRAHGG